MEIERKFAGKMSADFATIFGTVELHSLEQFYTQISKNDEVRYRTTDDGFVKTVKKGKGLTREETETPVADDEWNEAKKNMVGNYIEKERLKIPIGKLIIEIDVYSRPITNGWAMIEVEFPTEDDASCFSLPSKITQAFTKIREVTEDERFKNKNIALIGFPTFMDGASTGDEVPCMCGERDATWKGVPTTEFKEEYPDEDWYFCDDCMESLFAGTWSGGGPFSSDFTSFSKVGVERPPRPTDLDGRNVKVTKENITLHDQLDEMGHRWETAEADIANLTNAIDRVIGFLKIYPIGAHRRPGDNLDVCLNILQAELAKINSTNVKTGK